MCEQVTIYLKIKLINLKGQRVLFYSLFWATANIPIIKNEGKKRMDAGVSTPLQTPNIPHKHRNIGRCWGREGEKLLMHAGWKPSLLPIKSPVISLCKEGANHQCVAWASRPIASMFCSPSICTHSFTHTPLSQLKRIQSRQLPESKTEHCWCTKQYNNTSTGTTAK